MDVPTVHSSTKRKRCTVSSNNEERKMAPNKKKPESKVRNWGCTTELKVYDDPWRIKKKLRISDLDKLSRLLLSKDLVEDFVLPVLGSEAQRDIATEKGTKVKFLDINTQSEHYLVFKQWASSRSYVFIDNWIKDFVNRRSLKIGDEIGLQWDPYERRFNFSILLRA